jgi:hypothetical protein
VNPPTSGVKPGHRTRRRRPYPGMHDHHRKPAAPRPPTRRNRRRPRRHRAVDTQHDRPVRPRHATHNSHRTQRVRGNGPPTEVTSGARSGPALRAPRTIISAAAPISAGVSAGRPPRTWPTTSTPGASAAAKGDPGPTSPPRWRHRAGQIPPATPSGMGSMTEAVPNSGRTCTTRNRMPSSRARRAAHRNAARTARSVHTDDARRSRSRPAPPPDRAGTT